MRDPLSDIHQYSTTLTISQVVKFCEKKELGITRAMVQNYIRLGMLPPPVRKRIYTHKHLTALSLIGRMKSVFDMDTIKTALCPLMDDEGLELDIYQQIIKKWSEITVHWKKTMPSVITKDAAPEISRLALMAHAADVQILAEEMG
jgi:DNA-binding transcriptional MerR regulator